MMFEINQRSQIKKFQLVIMAVLITPAAVITTITFIIIPNDVRFKYVLKTESILNLK